MAHCHKCGGKVTKRPDKSRKCKSCGFMPGKGKLDRSGNPKPVKSLIYYCDTHGQVLPTFFCATTPAAVSKPFCALCYMDWLPNNFPLRKDTL